MSHILIIEDNQQNARLAAKILRNVGHSVELAETAEQGLTSAITSRPDLVLVDLGLPDMDGQTVLAILRQQFAEDPIPLVAFTAWPQDTVEQMTQAYGCDGVISKPVERLPFLQQVTSYLK